MMDVFHLIEGVTTIGAAVGWLVAYRAYNDEHQRATALERDLDDRDRYSDHDHLMLQIANSRIKDLIGQVDRITDELHKERGVAMAFAASMGSIQATIEKTFIAIEEHSNEAKDETDLESQKMDDRAEGETPCGWCEPYILLHADGGSDVRA